MKTYARAILSLGLCLVVSGCATPKQIVPLGTPSLWLAEPCERYSTRGIDTRFRFPAGEYRPVYQDAMGIYYRAIGDLIMGDRNTFQTWSVRVAADGSHALSFYGPPNPLDRPLPFTPMRVGDDAKTAAPRP
jgi:hypothetical protein